MQTKWKVVIVSVLGLAAHGPIVAQEVGPNTLHAKIEKVQQGVKEKEAKTKIPPISVALTMCQIPLSMQTGKLEEADKLADQALKLLEEPEDSIGKKVAQIQSRAQAMEKEGKSPIVLGMMISSLGGLVEKCNREGAETLVDRAMKVLASKNMEDAPEAQPYGRISKKLRKVQSMMPQYQQSGGDMKTVGPLVQKMERQIQAGAFEQIEKTLDDILVIVKE